MIKMKLKDLRQNDFPLILVDRIFDDFEIDSVSVSNREGAEKAIDFLYRKV
jgi:DNA-binding LacI/PurR family transcriptional regulator